MTRFRDVQQAISVAAVWMDDDKIKSYYNMNCNIQKEGTLHFVLRMRGEDSQHQWQRDHQDLEHLPYKAHEQRHVKWMCTQFSSLFS